MQFTFTLSKSRLQFLAIANCSNFNWVFCAIDDQASEEQSMYAADLRKFYNFDLDPMAKYWDEEQPNQQLQNTRCNLLNSKT